MVALSVVLANTDDGMVLFIAFVAFQLATAFFYQNMKPYEKKVKT